MAAMIALLTLGLPALDRALPNLGPARSDVAYLVGGNVSVVAPPGAAIDVTATRPGSDRGSVLFVLGSVRYAINVRPLTDASADPIAQLRQRISSTTYRIDGSEIAIATSSGLAGRQGFYRSSQRAGRYAVFVNARMIIEVTMSGDEQQLSALLPVLEASVHTLDLADA